jgi:serine-type D-Ala-D-Ala carboxypeptidase (penicillin-binding protein 5/6)
MRIVPGLLAAASFVFVTSAVARPQFESAAPIAYMVDMASGAVLFDKDSTRKIPPASMAKMMTTYVVFDLINRGELKPEQKFTVRPQTWKKWNNTGSTMFLKPNERVSVSDLLHGVVTVSGNDAAIVLAEGISGSEAGFVSLMNAKARQLGMTDSQFGTANGWPDDDRTLTTARDLALLGAKTIHDFPTLYRTYYGLKDYRWNNVTQPNRNPILDQIAGADGVKTGHTDEAGYCFTGTAEQNGRRIMMVVAGLGSMEARAQESLRLLHWGFDAWRAQPLYKAQSVVATLPVQLGDANQINLVAPHRLALALPAKDAPRYRLVVRYTGPLKAPLRKGTQVAQLVAKFDDGSEQAMPLVTAQSVAQAGYFGRAWNGLKALVRL